MGDDKTLAFEMSEDLSYIAIVKGSNGAYGHEPESRRYRLLLLGGVFGETKDDVNQALRQVELKSQPWEYLYRLYRLEVISPEGAKETAEEGLTRRLKARMDELITREAQCKESEKNLQHLISDLQEIRFEAAEPHRRLLKRVAEHTRFLRRLSAWMRRHPRFTPPFLKNLASCLVAIGYYDQGTT